MKPIGFGPPDFTTKKQLNYEQSRTKHLLQTFCGGLDGNVFQVMALIREAGDQFGFTWFNDKFASCPVAIESVKLKKPVRLDVLVSGKVTREEFFRAYVEVRSNYAVSRQVAMVFDHHGDMITDLVVHNVRSFSEESRFLCTLRPSWPDDGDIFWVSRWDDFCASLVKRYHPFL